MAKNWIWISGWAIYPDQFQSGVELAFPEDSHQVLTPGPDALQKALSCNADHIGGYSLGSLILLSAFEQIQHFANIVCLAPFTAFCKEENRGGATPKATLQALQRRLPKQPLKTIQLFYRLAGLKDSIKDQLPYPLEHLQWGLEQLATRKAAVNDRNLSRVETVAGLTDPLIDCETMRHSTPNCHFVDACNHDYRKLLTAFSKIARN